MPTFLALAIGLYLLVSGARKSRSLFLGVYFAIAFLFHLGYLVAYSWFSPAGALGWYLAALAPFGLSALIQFAYRFPEKVFHKEARFFLYVSLAGSLYAYIDYAIRSHYSPVGVSEIGYGSTYASQIIPILVTLLFLWTIVVLVRQALEFESRNSLSDRSGFFVFFFPKSKLAAATRNFALAVFFEMAMTFAVVLFTSFSLISFSAIHVAMNLVFLFVYSLYIAIYVHSGAHPVSLLYKIVGVSFAAVLFGCGVLGHVALEAAGDLYDKKKPGGVHDCPRGRT